MIIDFPLILLCLTVFSGGVLCVDYFARGRGKLEAKPPVLIDYAAGLFPVFLIVLLLRSFLVQPYLVPTGSLEPTVVPGDFIAVNQYQYGLKVPVWNHTIFSVGHPKRGDIALFRWPADPKITFVKRVVGLPGDEISYIHKVFYINGKPATQRLIGQETSAESHGATRVNRLEENLAGGPHFIYTCLRGTADCDRRPSNQDFYHLIVPPGHYFMVGDNRDNSDDSRFWGFVPEKALIGRAVMILLSWDGQADWRHKIRWHRIGHFLKATE